MKGLIKRISRRPTELKHEAPAEKMHYDKKKAPAAKMKVALNKKPAIKDIKGLGNSRGNGV